MRIGPLFKWFGSKWQSARRYPEPEHETIIEPFAGGAGYSLNYCDRNVFVADSDPNLFELWSWLIWGASSGDVRDIPIGVPAGTDIRTLNLNRGQQLLFKHWQRTNNVGDCWTISPWGHLPGQWTANTRARVAEEIHAVKHWLTFCTIDQPWSGLGPATWFIDPPYQYNYRYRGDLPAFDHAGLAHDVGTIDPASQVIACEAVCKNTGLVPDYLPFVHSHESVTSRRKVTQSHHSSEVIYVRP